MVKMMQKYSLQFRDKSVQSVLQRGQSKFVQLSLQPGEGLTKHRAPLGLTVIVLTGRIRFVVDDTVELLEASEMFALDAGVEHTVEALEQSTVLLVLTPDEQDTPTIPKRELEHVNAYQRPELIDQIAPELQPLVRDHVHVCQVLESVEQSTDLKTIKFALDLIAHELDSHFIAEEKVVFPRMANHVGGLDIGPVARLLEEHRHIRQLHAEAEELLSAYHHSDDQHTKNLLMTKVFDLSTALLNHLGKEDSHLFPMTSRLLTDEEKSAIAKELTEYTSRI